MDFVQCSKILLLLLLFVNQQLVASEPSFNTVITIAKSTLDVARFAFAIDEFVTRKESNKIGDIQDLIKATDLHIAASTTKILNTILLQSKLERIDDAVIAIHSSLIDLQKIIKSTDQTTYQTYKDDYMHFFRENELIKHIRFLPELLTYRVPGVGSELITEITINTRCNITALEEFADFYLNLLSNGIALQSVYYKFTHSLSSEQVLKDEWEDPINKVRKSFEDMIINCVNQLPVLAKQDVDNAVNIDKLASANQQRYSFNWSDVFFYASMRTEQFHYMKYKPGRLFRHDNDNNNKVAVFGRRGDQMTWDAAGIERKLNTTHFSIPPETDKEAAKNVAQQVEEYINSLGKRIGVILVFFDGEDFKMTGVRPDTDSPVVQYTLEGVVLEYCFDNGVVCTYRSTTNQHKKSSGAFRVYVYPGHVYPEYETRGEGDNNDEFETDGAATYFTLLSLFLAIVFYIATL